MTVRSSFRRLARVTLFAAFAFAEQPALADEPSASGAVDVAAARERGNAAMRSGRPADAREAYAAVYAATNDPAMLYNLARAEQALTHYSEATDLLRRFQEKAPRELVEKVAAPRLLAELEARVTTLEVRSAVDGAEVRLDGKVLGTTPLKGPVRVNAGKAVFDVRAEGHLPFTRTVTLAGGESFALELALVRADRSGLLAVRSPLPGAAVAVDGRPVGNVPVELSLEAGPHDVLVTKTGFEPSRSRMIVVTGERREANVDLAAKPGVLSRWWFWTGVGVALAGGAAAYVALTTEKAPPTGSIAPGQTSLGLVLGGGR